MSEKTQEVKVLERRIKLLEQELTKLRRQRARHQELVDIDDSLIARAADERVATATELAKKRQELADKKDVSESRA